MTLTSDSYFDLSIFLYEVRILNINLDCCIQFRFNTWCSVVTILSPREDLMMFSVITAKDKVGFDDVFGDHYKGQGRQMLLASNG